MKLIRPIQITDAIVTSNSAVDAHATYNAGTTYAADAMVTYNLRYYKSLQASNTGHTPGDAASVAWWSDQGPSNRAAMYDGLVSTRTTATGTLTLVMTVPTAVNTLSLINVAGVRTVTVTATKDAATVYSRTVDMWDTSLITDWAEYFFAEAELRTELALTDLPLVPGLVITTVLTGTATVGVGKFDLGRVLDAGLEQYGLKREGVDYTNVTFDNFGVATIGTQIYVRKFSTQSLIENNRLDVITRRLDVLASTPLVIIGANGRYDSMIVYGLLSYSLDLALYGCSYISFDVKGLV